MYLGNNLNKIRNNFHNIYDKYQRLFKHTASNEKKKKKKYQLRNAFILCVFKI